MEDKEHALYLREEIVTHEVQHDLDKLGIAKTAREEKKRARDSKAETNKVKNDAAYDARMAQLYREVVLKEKPATSNEGGFIPLGAIAGAIAQPTGIAPAPKKNQEVGEPVAGD
jgi:7,8-dihydro-6-hydroxymethylpterin dimethyltransferase